MRDESLKAHPSRHGSTGSEVVKPRQTLSRPVKLPDLGDVEALRELAPYVAREAVARRAYHAVARVVGRRRRLEDVSTQLADVQHARCPRLDQRRREARRGKFPPHAERLRRSGAVAQTGEKAGAVEERETGKGAQWEVLLWIVDVDCEWVGDDHKQVISDTHGLGLSRSSRSVNKTENVGEIALGRYDRTARCSQREINWADVGDLGGGIRLRVKVEAGKRSKRERYHVLGHVRFVEDLGEMADMVWSTDDESRSHD